MFEISCPRIEERFVGMRARDPVVDNSVESPVELIEAIDGFGRDVARCLDVSFLVVCEIQQQLDVGVQSSYFGPDPLKSQPDSVFPLDPRSHTLCGGRTRW
jgi:hypothetical protein